MDSKIDDYRSYVLGSETIEGKLLSTHPNNLLLKAAWLQATIFRHLFEKLIKQKAVPFTPNRFFYRSGELPISGLSDNELLDFCERAYFSQILSSFNSSIIAAERGYRVEARAGLRFVIESVNRIVWLKIEPNKIKEIAREKIE